MSTTNGTVLARLSRTELLVAVAGRDRLVATELQPSPRVGERVVVSDGVAVARLSPADAAVADAAGADGMGSLRRPPCSAEVDGRAERPTTS